MPWSRIDTGFWRHPKFEGWTAAQKWALGELIGYCCEYRTEGRVPADMTLLPRSVNKGLLELAERSGWLEREGGCLVFHDWHHYHPKDPTAANRQQRKRDKNRDTNRDETVTATVTKGVTTNTNTNLDQRPLSKIEKTEGGDERTGRIRHAQTDQDGLDGSPGEAHGSVFHLERVEPQGHDPSNVSSLRAFMQDRFGA